MLTQHIALVPEAGGVDLSELSRVSAALQKQVTRDLSPLWGVSATVDAFHELEDIPVGYWPIVISKGDLRRAAGVHLDRNGQPYAHIAVSPLWSVEASRACLEMLINPYGDRTTTAPSPRAGQGLVELLVEVCAPCASASNGYAINGVLVSDFCTPAFFGAATSAGRERFSFNGSLSAPFQLLRGGYLTWYEPGQAEWWMRVLPSLTPMDLSLGAVEGALFGARDLVRRLGPARLWAGSPAASAMLASTSGDREQAFLASRNRAHRLRSLLGKRLEESLSDDSSDGQLVLDEDDHWAEPTVLLSADIPEPATTPYQLRNLTTEGEPLEVAWLEPEAPVATPSVPPPLPSHRVSRASEVARARRALPAESRTPTVRTPQAGPSSTAPVEMLSLATPRQRSDGMLIATTALASAALFGLIWTQASSRGAIDTRPAVPSAAARPVVHEEVVHEEVVHEEVAPRPAPAVVAPTIAASAPVVAPVPAPAAGERVKPAHARRVARESSEPTAERAAERTAEPAAQPVADDRRAAALDELIDTRR